MLCFLNHAHLSVWNYCSCFFYLCCICFNLNETCPTYLWNKHATLYIKVDENERIVIKINVCNIKKIILKETQIKDTLRQLRDKAGKHKNILRGGN